MAGPEGRIGRPRQRTDTRRRTGPGTDQSGHGECAASSSAGSASCGAVRTSHVARGGGNNARRTARHGTAHDAMQCVRRRRESADQGRHSAASGLSAPNPRSPAISKLPIIHIMLTRVEPDLLRTGAAGRPRRSEIPGSPRIDAMGPTASGSSPAHLRTATGLPAPVPDRAADPLDARSAAHASGAMPQRRAHCTDPRFTDAALRQHRVVVSRARCAPQIARTMRMLVARDHPVPRGAATTDRPFSPLPHLMDNHRYP